MTMVQRIQLGKPVPLLPVAKWVQGEASNFDQLLGKVVLVEVFQVNCPGCFLYSLPKAIELHERYASQDLIVLAVATAFEDFDKNTLENLCLLLESGVVIGETKRILSAYGQLQNGRWPYRMPFPVAMDNLIAAEKPVSEQAVEQFIQQKLLDISERSADYQQHIRQRVLQHLQAVDYHAETFEGFNLQGTPSQMLVDKQGILRACRFGEFPELEAMIQKLLIE